MLCQGKSSLPSTHHLSFPCKANIYFASSLDFSSFCLKLTEGELNTISIQTYLLVSLSHNRLFIPIGAPTDKRSVARPHETQSKAS